MRIPTSRRAIAAAYVRGVQSEGVAACIKHFVGNDTEFERMSIDSQIDERTLRELYLVPFEAAVKEAGVLAVMTGYNRINGPFAADSEPMVRGVLREEWGFDGLVMSDWFGLHSTVEALAAGVDLEMPGPTRFRGQALLDAVERGDVTAEQVRGAALNVLTLMSRVGALATDGPGPELTRDDPDDRALIRLAGAKGMVLLRNEADASGASTLPLTTVGLRRVAVLGPNAAVGQIMGGGSAHVTPTHVVHPLEAIVDRLRPHGVEVVHAVGCTINRRLPELDPRLCGPLAVDYFADPGELDNVHAVPMVTGTCGSPRIKWIADPVGRSDADPEYGARISTIFTPDISGEWSVGVESVAPARMLVDDEVVLDNTELPSGGSFFGAGKAELTATVALEAGRPYQLDVEIRHHHTGMGLGGVNIGAQAPFVGDRMMAAVDAAAAADVSIVIVGTNDDWESEGWDRAELELPGSPGRADHPCRRGLPSHGRRGQRRIAGGDAVGRIGSRGAHGLVPRTGDGRRTGRRPPRRGGAAGPTAGHVPPPAGGHSGVRASSGPKWRGPVRRTSSRRLPLVRHGRAGAAVRVRSRTRVRGRDDHRGAAARSVHCRGRPHQRQRPPRVGRGAGLRPLGRAHWSR